MYLIDYITLSVFFSLTFIIISLLLLFLSLLSPTSTITNKFNLYECGFDPYKDSSTIVDPQFFLIGLLFLIFDLEIVLLYPWLLDFFNLSLAGFWNMFLFLFIVNFAFVYEWLLDALHWTIRI